MRHQLHNPSRLRLIVPIFLCGSLALWCASSRTQMPPVPPVTLAGGFQFGVYADQHDVDHPTAIAIDEQGNVLVAETNRFELQGYENFDAQLACQTLQDGQELAERSASSEPMLPERLRRLTDIDRDGTADTSQVLMEDASVYGGCAAGVATQGGDIWFGNAPRLWKLTQVGDQGNARSKAIVHRGFGVRPKLLGHDLHGLTYGPDGKLYGSMGDRGLHVETEAGPVSAPNCGSIFRCNPDGSEFELFATGLRNPQGLAFDAEGNLWTCDNDSNLGDRSRWIYVCEGGDYGWRIGYQLMPDCGPYQKEGICRIDADVPWRIPAIGYVARAPGGIAFNPGVGLPGEFDGCFFVADYAGDVWTVDVVAQGAGFRLKEVSSFAKVGCPTDVAFGFDGAMYVTDWVWPYQTIGQGRVLRITHSKTLKLDESHLNFSTATLASQTVEELISLLAHPHLNARYAVQAELVRRGPLFLTALKRAWPTMQNPASKRHALWALGCLQRTPQTQQFLTTCVSDPNLPESLRIQSLRAIRFRGGAISESLALRMLAESGPRLRYFTLMAIPQSRVSNAMLSAISKLLASEAADDPFLRHAAVVALAKSFSAEQLTAHATNHSSDAVRLGTVLALRRQQSSLLCEFLADPSDRVYLEAVRAIHDEMIEKAYPRLAVAFRRTPFIPQATGRIMSINHQLGDANAARRLASIATDDSVPADIKRAAIETLGDWSNTDSKNRVTGDWDPQAARSNAVAAAAYATVHEELISHAELSEAAISAAEKLGINEPSEVLLARINAPSSSEAARVLAVSALAAQHRSEFEDLVDQLLINDSDVHYSSQLRQQVVKLADRLPPQRLTVVVALIRNNGQPLQLRQAAVDLLGRCQTPEVRKALSKILAEPPSASLALELLQAERAHGLATQFVSTAADTVDRQFEAMLHGGDAKRGADIFRNNSSGQCSRCHQDETRSSRLGPSLAGVGALRSRREILDSIVYPSATIHSEFRHVTVVLESGKILTGRQAVDQNDAEFVTLVDLTGVEHCLERAEIESVSPAASPMPHDLLQRLGPKRIRDLIEFLSCH